MVWVSFSMGWTSGFLEIAETSKVIIYFIIEPRHGKTCLKLYANNKGANQPARPRSLISAFIVRCLGSIIPTRYI